METAAITRPSPQSTDDAMLIAFLAAHHASCPACKYDLYQLQQPRCPEYGRELSLTIGVVEPYLRTWVATAVLLCANAGVGIMFTLGMIKTLLSSHGAFPREATLWIIFSYYMAAIPLGAIFLWWRSWFVRLGRATQRNMLIAVAVVTAAGFIGLFSAMG
jgi:hypothetical protein